MGRVTMKNLKRLPLLEIFNVRDLGGYPIDENTMTKWGVFFRSGDLSPNVNDIDYLYKHGIRTIINLKIEPESPVANDKRFNYIHLPLVEDFSKFTGGMYPAILSVFSDKVKEAFECINDSLNNGGILFHCASGKDRTGVIAALLLSLLGVSELDIMANFVVSEIYLRPYAKFIDRPIESMPSPVSWIEVDFIEYIRNEYGGVEKYLRHIGISDKVLSNIKVAFSDNS